MSKNYDHVMDVLEDMYETGTLTRVHDLCLYMEQEIELQYGDEEQSKKIHRKQLAEELLDQTVRARQAAEDAAETVAEHHRRVRTAQKNLLIAITAGACASTTVLGIALAFQNKRLSLLEKRTRYLVQNQVDIEDLISGFKSVSRDMEEVSETTRKIHKNVIETFGSLDRHDRRFQDLFRSFMDKLAAAGAYEPREQVH